MNSIRTNIKIFLRLSKSLFAEFRKTKWSIWDCLLFPIRRGGHWLRRRRLAERWAIGITLVVIILANRLLDESTAAWIWAKYKNGHAAIAPLLTLTAGVAVALVALLRHFAQTDADRQRRITESFSKAIEQLASDKLEVRLGGIYALERISKESAEDYWTVMENLTAFVRERTRRSEAERTGLAFEQRVAQLAYFKWLDAGRPAGKAEEFWAQAVAA